MPSVHMEVDLESPNSGEGKIDYAWAVVDPTGDRTFWFAHNYRWRRLKARRLREEDESWTVQGNG